MFLNEITDIQALQDHYKENLVISILVKNAENKYLILKTPLYSNKFSIPMFQVKNKDNIATEFMRFTYDELNYTGIISKFLERTTGVVISNSQLTTVDILGVTMKVDQETTDGIRRSLRGSEKSGRYTEEKYVTLEELKRMFHGNLLDEHSMFFALRDQEVPENLGTSTVTFDTTVNV